MVDVAALSDDDGFQSIADPPALFDKHENVHMAASKIQVTRQDYVVISWLMRLHSYTNNSAVHVHHY